jgi:predicted metal-dependent HD superfamily phosphohydrolase
MTRARVEKSWRDVAASHKEEAFDVLASGYADPTRGYHNWSHLEDLLTKLDNLERLATRKDLLIAAIFWHDAVFVTYEPNGAQRPDAVNVRASAALFEKYSLYSLADTQAVCELILATTAHLSARASEGRYSGFSQDFDLFLDLDLSSLGASWRVFRENLDQIYFEYSLTPQEIFYQDRLRMFEKFQNCSVNLYRLKESRDLWLTQAQENIKRAKIELLELLAK